MDWKKYTIKTTTQAEDVISATLMELGIEGVEIEDNVPLSEEDKKKLFIDILPVLPLDDGTAYVSFYLEEEKEEADYLPKVEAALKELRDFLDIGEGTIVRTISRTEDWQDKWKEFFKPFLLENIVIKPTWEDTAGLQGDMVVELDPGTAFGTGRHETTQLVIRQMKKVLQTGDGLLDLGCGSGILSIIGLKLGAGRLAATDIDKLALEATEENMAVNGISRNLYQLYLGNVLEDGDLQEILAAEPYDVVVANILADVIIPLAALVPKFLKKGGAFISSGIIDTKEEAVKAAIQAAGLRIEEVEHQGEWVAVRAVK